MKTLRVAAALALLAAAAAAGPAQGSAASALTPLIRGHLAQLAGDKAVALRAYRDAVKADPDSAELRAVAARGLAAGRQLAPALEFVEEGIRRAPDHGGLLLLRSKLLAALGRREEAVGPAQLAVAKGAAAEAYPFLVGLLHSMGRGSEAAEAAAGWAAAAPKSVDAQFALGFSRLQSGDKKGARAAFEGILEQASHHPGALRNLARLEEEAGEAEKAVQLYRRTVELNPHDVESVFRLGQLLIKLNRSEEALALFDAPGGPSKDDPDVSLRLGSLLLLAEKPAEAESVLDRLSRSHPEQPALWYLLGVSREVQGEHEAALEAFEKVPPTAPQYAQALLRRAYVLAALGRKAAAIALLASRLAAAPDDEPLALTFAGFVDDEPDQRRAVEILKALLGKKPSQRAELYFTLGMLHDKLKEWQTGAEYIKQSLSLRPDDPQALNYLGYTYAEHGVHLDEAEKLIIRALELKPEAGDITDSLGWVYYKQGRYQEAVAQLRRAVELSPKDAVIWDHLGDALRAVGDSGGAGDAYRKAESLDPSYAPARQKLLELKP